MKTALPVLWFIYGIASLLSPIIMSAFMPAVANQMALLAGGIPQGLNVLAASVAIGLVYMFVIRTRYSTATLVLGILHLLSQIVSLVGRILGDSMRDQLFSQLGDPTQIGRQLAMIYGATYMVYLLGWLLFIVMLIIALNTKRSAAADVF